MRSIPTTEAILLQVHQSLGCPSDKTERYSTQQKRDFATCKLHLDNHKEKTKELFDVVFTAMGMDPEAQLDLLKNLNDLANFNQQVSLKTWTYAADQNQILWQMLGRIYIPGIARYAAFWSIDTELDKGMPGGRFWYLPGKNSNEDKYLHLPVAQVADWLLDLLERPLEEFVDERNQSLKYAENDKSDTLMRSLYNWRKKTIPNPASFREYFPDEMVVEFKGAFSLDSNQSPTDQFAAALSFVKRKGLTAELLRQEIPMTEANRLENILEGASDENEMATFVARLTERYAAPSSRTIRQRFLFARMVQDGYTRLLKKLCPGVDPRCADPSQNKLLQLIDIYKRIYNFTISAWRNCKELGETAENEWFEEHLPPWDKDLFLSILPSQRETAAQRLAMQLTRNFFEKPPGAVLEDFVGTNKESQLEIIRRNAEGLEVFGEELLAEVQLIERMKTASPWRTLQSENRFWVISQVAQYKGINPLAKAAALQRLHELATNPQQETSAILIELGHYFDLSPNHRPKDICNQVQRLIEKAESSKGYELCKAPLLLCKAKHLLASNEFEGAAKIFRVALEASQERNYGSLRGEIARDLWGLEVANQRLIPENHHRYYREMLRGDMFENGEVQGFEDTAREVAEYFWNTQYKPYPGVKTKRPKSAEEIDKMLEVLEDLLFKGDQGALRDWIDCNRKLLDSRLPHVTGDSVLMSWIKARTNALRTYPLWSQMLPTQLKDMSSRMSENWRQGILHLVRQAPNQLNIIDYKGQTPLMLMAEAGDDELVLVMLESGADPDIHDYQGKTALHSAVASASERCFDLLLEYSCDINKVTFEEQSVLHTAVKAGNVHAVRQLLNHNPDLINRKPVHGLTPLELAEFLIGDDDSLVYLNKYMREQGKRTATKKDLLEIVQMMTTH